MKYSALVCVNNLTFISSRLQVLLEEQSGEEAEVCFYLFALFLR